MKIVPILCLLVTLASAGEALAVDRSLTAEWGRMPKDARLAYMAGAVTGFKVFGETQGGVAAPAKIVIEQAVSAMDQLAADAFNQSLPMMAVAAAALALVQGQDPRPRLALGHMLVNPDDPMNRLYAMPENPQAPVVRPAAKRGK